MNIKNLIYKVILGVASLYCIYACNDKGSETTYIAPSSDGQIRSFSVSSIPTNATDTLTYPFLKKAFFTILSSETEGFKIFNVDSLPVRTNIGTLHLTLAYTASPSAVQLVYLDMNRVDSIADWNTTDSVKFIYDDSEQMYYPKLNVVAQNGTSKRLYTVDFNIHKVNPDSIVWTKPTMTGGALFQLPKKGESKVVSNENVTEFYSLIKEGNTMYFYTSSVGNLSWASLGETKLPATTLPKSLILNHGKFTVLTSDGLIYRADEINYTGWSLVNSDVKFGSLIGVLPEIKDSELNEYFVSYYNVDNKLAFAKTKNFETIEEVEILGVNNTLVGANFPIHSYSSVYREINGVKYIILTGGYNAANAIVNYSWFITNNSLVDPAENSKAQVAVLPGKNNSILPFEQGLTTFVYNDSIQALSADSLRLYTSFAGDVWNKQSKNNELIKGFEGMNVPSVIVDDSNYIWVFGGENSKGTKVYSQQIWRGRMNKLTPKTK